MKMTKRQEEILAHVVLQHIETARPVSSKQLELLDNFDVSSATLRAEMNELEETGFLTHPYTSGGRMPTDKGYRYFVDHILPDMRHELDVPTMRAIGNAFEMYHDFGSAVFNRALARAMSDVSDNLIITSLDRNRDVYKTGLASLFGLPEFSMLDHVSNVARFFDQFDELFYQMTDHFFRPARAHDRDIYVYIGRENPFDNIQGQTMMTTRYRLPNSDTISLTLVGPKRMDYGRNIALLRYIRSQINSL